MTRRDKLKYKEYLASEQDEERAYLLWFRWKCQNDLLFLFGEVIGVKYARSGPGRGRSRWDGKLFSQMAKYFEVEDDALMLYPRGHLKTSFAAAWVVQRLLINPNVRIGVWSRTTPLARSFLGLVKQHLLNPKLMEAFPEVCMDRGKWEKDTADALTTARDSSISGPTKEEMVECWGIDSTVTGRHYDYHLYDDIINEQSVTSATQIEKVRVWWSMVQAIKESYGIEKIIGTRYHWTDIYGEIMEQGYFNHVVVRKAIENGKPIYSYNTIKNLDKLKRRMGEYEWSTQMMNDAVPKGQRIFVPPYPLYTKDEFERIKDDCKYYVTVDPAMTENRYNDQTGLAVGAVNKKDPTKVYIVEAYGIRKKPDEVSEEIVRLMVKYKPVKVGIEFGLQASLQYLINADIKEHERSTGERINCEFVAISTKQGQLSKSAKIERTAGAFIRSKRILLKASSINGSLVPDRSMIALIRQMDMYNPNVKNNEDDIVDAVGMQVQTIEHFAPAYWYRAGEESNQYALTAEYLMKKFGKKKKRKYMRGVA